jgi:FkbM family methyltransferase
VLPEQETYDLIYTLNPFVEFQLHRHILYKPSDVFIDVGSFIGVHAISWAVKSPIVKVFALDPAPRNHEKLNENIEEDKISNVKSLDIEAGATFANHHFPNLITSKLTGGGREESNTARVKVFRIDQLVDLDSIGREKILINIHVEGNEKKVLEGITNILKSSRDVGQVIEIWQESEVRVISHILADFGVEKVGNTSGSNFLFEREFSFQESDTNDY